MQEKSLGDIRTQIDQLRSNMVMKEAEMGTELVDHLTPEEREQLSRLNPEIKELKEKLIAYKADRIEVGNEKKKYIECLFSLELISDFCAFL